MPPPCTGADPRASCASVPRLLAAHEGKQWWQWQRYCFYAGRAPGPVKRVMSRNGLGSTALRHTAPVNFTFLVLIFVVSIVPLGVDSLGGDVAETSFIGSCLSIGLFQ